MAIYHGCKEIVKTAKILKTGFNKDFSEVTNEG